ncbi:hypothetical protein J3Q64DRAFT_1808928 [Phycomyces blakesleeanus]|uniref:Uncharacterized protein n=1 Tax=Phycomyces blakesleeanus TaxID=4837 RepID=A0ABR3B597_PHYBL
MAKKIFGEDEEIIVPEPIKKTVDVVEEEEDSDDDAPEVVSTSATKSAIAKELKAQQDEAARLAQLKKEKRRQRDQILKEQKATSKRGIKQKAVKKVAEKEKEEKEDEVNEDEAEEDEAEEADEADEEAEETTSTKKLLPTDLLAQFAEEEKATRKRNHMSLEDFERLEEEEEEEKRKTKKSKKTERRVGEYTVRVLNNRPRPQSVDAKILSFRNQKLNRKSTPRKDAVRNSSQGRAGGALIFARKNTSSH